MRHRGSNRIRRNPLQEVATRFIQNPISVTGEAEQNAALDTAMVTLTLVASAVAPDFSIGNFFSLTLAGTDTLSNPINIPVNKMGAIIVRQPSAGAKTLAFGEYYKFQGGADPTISSGANAIDVLYFHVLSGTEIACNIVQGLA